MTDKQPQPPGGSLVPYEAQLLPMAPGQADTMNEGKCSAGPYWYGPQAVRSILAAAHSFYEEQARTTERAAAIAQPQGDAAMPVVAWLSVLKAGLNVQAATAAREYARGHEQAAMWIWWAMLCGQPPDMVPYQDRPGNDPVWLRDVDAPPCNGTLGRELEPVDWRWITRENAQRTIEREAEKARARAEWEARRAAQS